ncbi:MAG TPA: F0F1 ATP synthase subunit delta [Patescibacteria group bacterium]
MQNDKIISEILDLVTTEDEKDSLTLVVEDLLSDLYKVDHSEFEKKMGQMEEKISVLVKQVPAAELPNFLGQLKEKLIATASVKVTLSFKPTVSFISRLNKTLDAIVEVEVNPDILGGVVVESNGKHVDMSVKKVLDGLLASV